MLAQAPNNEGVYVVPAFVGLGAPHWDPYARAAIMGMSRGSGRSHIIRAALESIAYQVNDAVELMQSESGIRLKELRADGGASDNITLMQFQADILERRVIKSEVAELSAMGSVYLGGLGFGFWLSLDELKNRGQAYSIYESKMQENIREQYIAGWNRAVASVLCTNKKTEA